MSDGNRSPKRDGGRPGKLKKESCCCSSHYSSKTSETQVCGRSIISDTCYHVVQKVRRDASNRVLCYIYGVRNWQILVEESSTCIFLVLKEAAFLVASKLRW